MKPEPVSSWHYIMPDPLYLVPAEAPQYLKDNDLVDSNVVVVANIEKPNKEQIAPKQDVEAELPSILEKKSEEPVQIQMPTEVGEKPVAQPTELEPAPIADKIPAEQEVKDKPAIKVADFSLANNPLGLVLLMWENETQLGPPQAMLDKLLGAIHTRRDDVMIFTLKQSESMEYAYFIKTLKAKTVICFGMVAQHFKPLVPETPKNQILGKSDCKFIFTDNLDSLFRDAKLKAELWKVLQIRFKA